ncbi:MAG: hypothetical protein ABI397_02665 [Candidatus Saccharimonas sp.]
MSDLKAGLAVRGGRIVRPGAYREPTADASKDYLKVVASDDHEVICPLCPENIEKRNKIITKVGSSAFRFWVIDACAPYAHWDILKVVKHELIVPEDHIEDEYDIPLAALKERNDYVHFRQESAPYGTAFQTYTRSSNNTSKSVSHLHTNAFTLSNEAPVVAMSYNSIEGLVDLAFAQLSGAEIDAIESYHRPNLGEIAQ